MSQTQNSGLHPEHLILSPQPLVALTWTGHRSTGSPFCVASITRGTAFPEPEPTREHPDPDHADHTLFSSGARRVGPQLSCAEENW